MLYLWLNPKTVPQPLERVRSTRALAQCPGAQRYIWRRKSAPRPVVMSPSVALVLLLVSSVLAQDSFLETARAACLRQGHLLPCAKYKIANFVHRIASSQRSLDLGPLRLVSIPGGNSTQDELMARAAEYAPREPELLRMFKYGVRQLDLFLNSHGLSLPLDSAGAGPYVVHDDGTRVNTVEARGIHSKKKLALLFPLLVILKFGIIKAILVPILLGVLFIKKMIILGVMALPSILSVIKACKIVPPYHTAYHSAVYQPVEEYGHDVTSYGGQGYGYGSYGGYESGSYGKDWGANQRKTRERQSGSGSRQRQPPSHRPAHHNGQTDEHQSSPNSDATGRRCHQEIHHSHSDASALHHTQAEGM
ncbi:uncharacterized protein LOC129003747 [Macrosteles quadrilineatus]|uniref:uncharacterized protein LOC129003747 n=1 Tax=Macrosteles quadrilineatus TaxID=74068 RepID=UPI0023E19989|nr:uncharacterized protein LOC129003747 [Macrosteles quadrilineatus]